jgi:transposase
MAEVTLVCLRPKDGVIEMQLRAHRSFSTCPACGTASRRVHSHYQRKLADLPWAGLPVVILLQARKFFCVGDGCRRKIFTEHYLARWHVTRGAAADRAKLGIEEQRNRKLA